MLAKKSKNLKMNEEVKKKKRKERSNEVLVEVNLCRDELTRLLELGHNFKGAYTILCEQGKFTCTYSAVLKNYFGRVRKNRLMPHVPEQNKLVTSPPAPAQGQRTTLSASNDVRPVQRQKIGSAEPEPIHDGSQENALKSLM